MGIDAAPSRIPAVLERVGLLENTVILVTADHGERFFEHGRVDHGWFPDGSVLHVPLPVAGPGIPPAVRIPEVVRTIDIDRIQGRSDGPLHLVAVSMGDGGEYAIRDGRYKLRYYPRYDKRRLDDLAEDPGGEHDLAAERPEIVFRLEERLARQVREDAALRAQVGRPREKELSPEVMRQLRALGYVK